MKLFVTGGAGYIGSILVPELLNQGHEVTVIDNFMYNQTSLLDCCSNPKFAVIRGDCRDKNLISECLKKADMIIPLACLTGVPACKRDPFSAMAVNLDAIKMLLKLRHKSQGIIFPTTNSGYGIGKKNAYCDENTALRPISLYGRLKVKAEEAILESTNSITFRLATAFGISPRMRLDLLVNDFTYRAVFDRFIVLFEADFKRNYIHVRDIANAFLHGIKNFNKMKGCCYNVGLSDCNISKRELCLEIKKIVPEFHIVEAEIGEDPDRRDYIVSNARIEATGFKPRFSLRQGIEELARGYQIIRRNQYTNV